MRCIILVDNGSEVVQMKKDRMMELLRSAVNHIENFEDSESNSVLEALGFTGEELDEIRQKRGKKESSKKIDAADDYSKQFDSKYIGLPYDSDYDFDDYDRVIESNNRLLNEINDRCKAKGTLVGRYFETPVADGFAFYQVIEVTKTKARVQRCVGLGDDYRDPQFMDCSLVNISYIQALVEETEHARKFTFPVGKI